MPFHSHRLANGLQIIGETLPAARSVAVGFHVRTGSRDETPELAGVSHFLEHMVFKGTDRRSALEVNLELDRLGGMANAFTTFENTVYHINALPEFLPRAVDLLADLMRPSLRQDDFDVEKKVILDEILRYEDQPDAVAFDRAHAAHFAGHPLAGCILGTTASVSALTREQMQEYFNRRYGASNLLLAVAGNFDWDALVRLAEQQCGHWLPGEPGRTEVREVPGQGGLHVFCKEKVKQEYVIEAIAGPPSASPLRYAADTLAVILGDDSGSRLYWALLHPGRVEEVSLSFTEYEGTGAYFLSLSGSPEATAENLAIVDQIFEQVQQEGVTEAELQQAISKNLARWVRVNELPFHRMGVIAHAWYYQQEYRDVDTELKAYESVTRADIRAVLDRYPLTRATKVAYGPLRSLEPSAANGCPTGPG